MQLRILDRHAALPAETRRAIEREVRLVIGRYAGGIARLQLTFGPVRRLGEPTPPADADEACRMRVELHHGETITVGDVAPDRATAARGAAWRLQRRLRQRLELRDRALP